MSALAAVAVTARLVIILLSLAMLIGWREQVAAVLLRRPGWQAHLSTFIATGLALGGAIISSVNIFTDADWRISENVRLAIVDVGLIVFCVGLLTSIYRRALRSGPEKARAAFLAGMALALPAVGFVALLTLRGANG